MRPWISRLTGNQLSAFLLAVSVLLAQPAIGSAATPLKVGVFQNKPIVYYDSEGEKGLFVEVLDQIAAQEQWTVEYVRCELHDCLQQLASGQLDLMTSLGINPERLQQFAFSKEPVWTFWGTIYAKDLDIHGILDLAGKRIGVRKENNITTALKKLLTEFEISVHYVEFDNYESIFEALREGEIDAAAVNNTYVLHERLGDVVQRTPIVFNPFSAYFATSKHGPHVDKLAVIDRFVKRFKQEPLSVIHTFEKNWFGGNQGFWTTKRIVLLSIALVVLSIIGTMFWRNRTLLTLNRQLAASLSELQRTEQALRASEERLLEAQEIARLGRWELELATRHIFGDEGTFRLFEIDRSSNYLSYETFLGVVHPEDRSLIEQASRILVETGKRHEFEHRLLMPDGRIKWIAATGRAEYDSSGSPLRIIGTVQEISERKQAEEALSESEKIHQHLVEIASDAIYLAAEDGTILHANPAAAQMLGRTVAEITSLNIGKIDPQCPPELFRKFWKDIQEDTPQLLDTFHIRKDGSRFPVEVNATKFHSNQRIYFLGVARDITERKRAEETLARKDALLQAMLRNLPFDFWARDTEQRIIMQSDESIHLWGDLTEDPSADSRFDSHTLQHWQANNQRVLAGEQIVGDCTLVTKSGERRDFHNIVVPIREGETILGILGINIDLTDRKRAEEEKRTLQAQLIQSQKMEAIGTLAGGIAHDFNNILGAVIGYAEMARAESPNGSRAAKMIDRVLEAGHRAAALVSQILAFSRQVQNENIPLAPGPIVKEVAALLRPTLPSTITISLHIETHQTIFTDPTQFHQIVMNLCTNAFHAMEQTGGTLDLRLEDCELTPSEAQLHPEVRPGRFIRLSVKDTGPGIPSTVRTKIFDPYFTTKGVGKGTGMGLAIVHGIVTNAGGFITCDSTPGQGTLFQVYFPIYDQQAVPQPRTETPLPTGTEHILLVDDEPMLAELGQTFLERLGYTVTACTSSLEALSVFQKQPDLFHAVITDQTMPGLTGTDLAKQLLTLRPDIPIILCTGFSNLVDEDQAREYGIKGFAMKPLTGREIATLLRTVLTT